MKKIYGFALAAALLSLASCSSESSEPNQPEPIKGETVGYVKMSLPNLSDIATRAGEQVTFTFKDANGSTQVEKVDIPTANEGVVVTMTIIPTSVTVTVGTKDNDGYTTSLSDFSGAAGYTAANTSSTEVTLDAKLQVFKTQAEAVAGTGVTIYLDPVVAKASLDASKAGEEIEIDSKLDGYSITFKPEVAFINGIPTKTKLERELPALTNGNATIQGTSIAKLDIAPATGTAHWSTATEWTWENTTHYSISGDAKGNGTLKQNLTFFENTPSAGDGHVRDYTHVIVAGKYVLTPTGDADAVAAGTTFYTFGVENNKAVVYTDLTKLKKAMGGDENSVLVAVHGGNNENRNIVKYHLQGKSQDITCVKYDQGYVYYAAAIETPVGASFVGKGVVRNHNYTIEVKTISGMGVPVADINTPIIPEDKPTSDTYYMNLLVKVNPFVNVKKQEIEW